MDSSVRPAFAAAVEIARISDGSFGVCGIFVRIAATWLCSCGRSLNSALRAAICCSVARFCWTTFCV